MQFRLNSYWLHRKCPCWPNPNQQNLKKSNRPIENWPNSLTSGIHLQPTLISASLDFGQFFLGVNWRGCRPNIIILAQVENPKTLQQSAYNLGSNLAFVTYLAHGKWEWFDANIVFNFTNQPFYNNILQVSCLKQFTTLKLQS